MPLVDELKGLKSLRVDEPSNAESVDLETLAYAVACTEDARAREQAVQIGVRWTRRNDAVAAPFLAWLLVYRVVLPLQILQAIVYTKNTKLVEICGTQHFENDSIQYLGLPECRGAAPRHEFQAERAPVFVDFLSVETSLETGPAGSEARAERQKVDATVLAKKAEQNELASLKSKVRGIIMGSMSAEEIAHKIARIASKKTSAEIVDTLVQTCIDEKTYNRVYGNIGYKLCRQSPYWAEVLHAKFSDIFSHTGESLNTNQLNVAGALFGHLLSLGAVEWTQMFTAVSLDPDASTASNRILLQAVMQELRQELGMPEIERKLASPELEAATGSIFTGEFAAQFWEVTGFPNLVKLVSVDSDSTSDNNSDSDSNSNGSS